MKYVASILLATFGVMQLQTTRAEPPAQTQPAETAKQYKIRISPPRRVGDTFPIATRSEWHEISTFTVAAGQPQEQNRQQALSLDGDVTVVKIDDQGVPTVFTLNVRHCTLDGRVVVEPGSKVVLDRTSGPTTVTLGGVDLPPVVGAAIGSSLAIVSPIAPLDGVYGTDKPRRVGESWSGDAALFERRFKFQGESRIEVTLAGVSGTAGNEVLELAYRFAKQGKRRDVEMAASGSGSFFVTRAEGDLVESDADEWDATPLSGIVGGGVYRGVSFQTSKTKVTISHAQAAGSPTSGPAATQPSADDPTLAAKGDSATTEPAGVGTPHRIRIMPPLREGDTYSISSKNMWNEAITVGMDGGHLRSGKTVENTSIKGVLTVRKVGDDGSALIYACRIDEAASDAARIPPGTTVVIDSSSRTAVMTVEKGEFPQPLQFRLMTMLFPIAMKHNVDIVYGSATPRRVGESWAVDPKEAATTTMGTPLEEKVTLTSVKNLSGRQVIQLDCRASAEGQLGVILNGRAFNSKTFLFSEEGRGPLGLAFTGTISEPISGTANDGKLYAGRRSVLFSNVIEIEQTGRAGTGASIQPARVGAGN